MFYGFFIFGPMQEIGNIIISYREAEASLNNFDRVMKKEVEEKPFIQRKSELLRNWNSNMFLSASDCTL
jgi:ATP-binding cassette subfamily B protein